MDIQELILQELRDVKSSLNEVRTKDIPEMKSTIAGFHENIKALKKSQSRATQIYTVLGGAIAVAIAKFTGHS